jgi:hypothetical protein
MIPRTSSDRDAVNSVVRGIKLSQVLEYAEGSDVADAVAANVKNFKGALRGEQQSIIRSRRYSRSNNSGTLLTVRKLI